MVATPVSVTLPADASMFTEDALATVPRDVKMREALPVPFEVSFTVPMPAVGVSAPSVSVVFVFERATSSSVPPAE